MNYRHSFHAGNFADVFKHAIFARVLSYLLQKQSPLRVIDTHSGVGVYDLNGTDASRTGEWEKGIGLLRTLSFSTGMKTFLEPYLSTIASMNAPLGLMKFYPGSPELARRLLRSGDRLVLCELHPED